MKILKFFTCAMILVALASCQKHEITYNTRELDNTDAEFQLHYFEPVQRSASAYYIDSVFVNDILYSSVNGSGQLASYNAVPGGSAGRFFAVKAGEVKFTFWRGGAVVYENKATLVGGKKQNVFVYDMTKAPVVIENDFPYELDRPAATAKDWGTDSVASVRFYNFMYEEPGVPYPGKLQYQWRNDVKDASGEYVWHNVGEPVGFGQASSRAMLIVHKTTLISQGSQSIYYRILTEDGSILQTVNSSGKMTNYSDYWTATIGRAMSHIWAGVRTSKNPYAYVSQWYNK
ncbi:MAG: hypothetical protein KBS58_00455 [Bacteroidales bacterium]|nr:hypothetical protein [Candidatus Cacconaster equi]